MSSLRWKRLDMSLIQVDNLSVSYGAHKVLSHVSMEISKGEIVTIVGPNGSGKRAFRARS